MFIKFTKKSLNIFINLLNFQNKNHLNNFLTLIQFFYQIKTFPLYKIYKNYFFYPTEQFQRKIFP